MNRLKYRVWITPWGDSESYMQHIEDLKLHVYIGNWERGGYKNAIFQQYIGLKDKNEKEIYEGDIVTTIIHDTICYDGREEIGFIYWDDFHIAWQFETAKEYPHHAHGSKYPFGADDNCWVDAEDMEIVGNIFETPELIKNKNE